MLFLLAFSALSSKYFSVNKVDIFSATADEANWLIEIPLFFTRARTSL